jgi:Gpi18-like mannosyltransferase
MSTARPNGTGRPTASDPLSPDATTGRWSRGLIAILVVAFIAGIAIRIALLPAPGLVGDLDVFVLWVHAIAVNGLGNIYDQDLLSFPPVMAYIWGVLAFIEPTFRTVTDSSDLAIRVLMKVPASLADIGLALLVVYALRARPPWAVVAAAVVLLHPAILDVSAWWGQYESIYLLSALAAVILALDGRNGPAAVLIAVSLMTKPQALPFILPFAAWFWTHGGWRELLRTAAIGLAVIVVLWLPFIPAGGPVRYLEHLAKYQTEIFPYLSLHAWNIWWIVQVAAVGGFASDQIAVIGPVTLRNIGLVVTGLLSLVVAFLIVRDPRPRTFILGLAASTLIWFTFLTQMHERYAYGALIFLLLLIPERRIRWLYLAFGVVYTLDLWSASPPAPFLRPWLPFAGLFSVVGALVMIAITWLTFTWMTSRSGDQGRGGPDHQVEVDGVPASV